MPRFKLLKGSFATTVGDESRVFRANDPKNNIVESKEDLVTLNPGKFAAVTVGAGDEGDEEEREKVRKARAEDPTRRPPPPPTGHDMAEALHMSAAARGEPAPPSGRTGSTVRDEKGEQKKVGADVAARAVLEEEEEEDKPAGEGAAKAGDKPPVKAPAAQPGLPVVQPAKEGGDKPPQQPGGGQPGKGGGRR
jgi:hypothetical protein